MLKGTKLQQRHLVRLTVLVEIVNSILHLPLFLDKGKVLLRNAAHFLLQLIHLICAERNAKQANQHAPCCRMLHPNPLTGHFSPHSQQHDKPKGAFINPPSFFLSDGDGR